MDIVGYEIVFVLVGGILALIRGHHVFVGMLVSLVLGPIGWLLVLLVKPKPQRTIKCPQCAELIQRDAKVCRFCGANVTGGATSPRGATPPQ